MQCMAPLLDADEVTLGTYFELPHLAATPVGLIIRAEVEIIKVDGKRVEFPFTTFDEREKVADGTHERYVTTYKNFKECPRSKTLLNSLEMQLSVFLEKLGLI